jgi:hypothetical protein
MKKPLLIVVIAAAMLSMVSAAYARDVKFKASLSGAQEVPPVATAGTGKAEFESEDGMSVAFELEWKDLSTSAFAAHIHCGVTGQNGPVGVTLFAGPRGTEGEVKGVFVAPDPGNGCGWDDVADVLAAMAAGGAYVNIHTTQHPGGEIRGQIAAA